MPELSSHGQSNNRLPDVVVEAGAGPSPGLAGAFAAVVAAALRRSHNGAAMRVLAAGPAAPLEADLARVDPRLAAVTMTVLLANEAFAARVVVSCSAAAAAPLPAWGATELASLGAVPLTLCVVACSTRVTAAEFASLRAGDALLPGTWRLGRSEAGVHGAVLLASPSSDVGIRAQLEPDGRLVLGGDIEPLLRGGGRDGRVENG